MAIIEVPDFEFSGFYYPEIISDLIAYLRGNLPEISDEDPSEPAIQLLRAYALTAHMNNVLLDAVARERFLPTAELRESVRAHLALIGVSLKQATPATVGLILQLSRLFTGDTVIVSPYSVFSSSGDVDNPAVPFEVLEAVSVVRTDQPTFIRSCDASGPTWVDHALTADIEPWTTPGVGDCLYIGHTNVMWDKLTVSLPEAASSVTESVWEYYDGSYEDCFPTAVDWTTVLTFNLNGWLGTSDRTGTIVRVKCNLTGVYQDNLVTYFDAGVNKVQTGISGTGGGGLGQTSPSTNVNDYVIGSLWQEVPGLSDETVRLTVLGSKNVSFVLPQSTVYRWIPALVGATGDADEAYWLRYRVISVSGGTFGPHISANSLSISGGGMYVYALGVQGQSCQDNPLGTANGDPSQIYTFSRYPVIDDVHLKIFITEGTETEWSRVDNFLNSLATDRHYTVAFDDDGQAVITFGDGINGKKPSAGSSIRSEYRTMSDINGNLGPGEVIVNSAGSAYITRLWNPRSAAGYAEAEGSTPEDLARLKISGPASIRVSGRAVTANDVETLAANYTALDGTNPCVRALCIEEGYGAKTVKLVVVGTGGVAVEPSVLTDMDDYFNGNTITGIDGVLLLNTHLTSVNYTPHPIDVTADVYGGTVETVVGALNALLLPNALRSDGAFEWEFGETVPFTRLISAIMAVSPNIRKVDLTVPNLVDVSLGADELPTAGAISITILA